VTKRNALVCIDRHRSTSLHAMIRRLDAGGMDPSLSLRTNFSGCRRAHHEPDESSGLPEHRWAGDPGHRGAYIVVGASMPSNARPFFRVVRVAATSVRRAVRTGSCEIRTGQA